jgi:hypothetical protein
MKDFYTLDDLEEYLNKIEKELKSLKESIGIYKEEPKEWELKIGDEFYTISAFGDIRHWEYKGHEIDLNAFRIGNAFKTREEAESELERRKVITELKKYSKAYNPNENNVCIFYSYAEDDFIPYLESYDCNEIEMGAYYFESVNMAEKAIKEIGKERIKKYLLGVEG